MRIKCKDHWHDVSPTGLAIVIAAFQEGDLSAVISSVPDAPFPHAPDIVPLCVLRAFDDRERIADFKRRYKGNVIMVDSVRR